MRASRTSSCIWSVVIFRKSGQDEKPWKPTPEIVERGPYRITRNPMYLGMALVLLGTAITVGAFSALLVPPIFMAIIEFRFIRPEEAMLRELFGEDFDAYCKLVRRWL